uniref:Uncharacterized protein n=1 Tax=Oryza punctata TaxID=4537 RepID=A0A0E0M459_ORYPU
MRVGIHRGVEVEVEGVAAAAGGGACASRRAAPRWHPQPQRITSTLKRTRFSPRSPPRLATLSAQICAAASARFAAAMRLLRRRL